MFRKVAVAISGGVDSAVAAIKLLEKGFSVSGIYMKNWDVLDETGHCTGTGDVEDAKIVCQQLKIPYHEVNFVADYWNYVFMDFIADYEKGLTPNPDVLCNKYIKFDKLLEYSLKEIGADALATGHYANNSFGPYLQHYDCSSKPRLLIAADSRKDQTFFLSQISNHALKKTMFPLAKMQKKMVKEIARQNNLYHVADKKESQGICFIGPRKFQEFISEYISPEKGNFIDIDTGKVVGEHNGIHQWTVGQKCRIGGLRIPYYVVKKDSNNDIIVASGHNHPALFNSVVSTGLPHWIHTEPEDLKNGQVLTCWMRFQHGKPLTGCLITKCFDGGLEVKLDQSLRALTPGQYCVFYKDNECLGSARILFVHNELIQAEAGAL